jgi:hypothetical protein
MGKPGIKLIDDWKAIAKRAWSVRLMLVAAVLSGGAVAVPFVAPVVPTEYLVAYAAVVFLVVTGAIIARFVAQKNLGVDIDAG